MEWSPQQTEIFKFAATETNSLSIVAVAGAGKTSTVVEMANRLPSNMRWRFLAFNKIIAEALQSRLPSYIPASTMHSLGYAALRKFLDTRYLKLDARKTWMIIDECMAPDQQRLYGTGIKRLVSLAKCVGIVPRRVKDATALTLDTEQNWVDLMEHYDIEFEGKDADPLQGIKYSRKVLAESITQGKKLIDFDDMLYLPTIWQARFEQFDGLMVDEAQDTNMIQRAILRMSLKPGGRLFAVGDPAQSIYAFRGADSEAMDLIKEEFNCAVLPLSVSYRCPKAVVREAHQYVSHIQPAESAPDGIVQHLGTFGPNTFKQTDAILCRNTAPLIELAFTLLKAGKACKVLGRDIGQGLARLIRQLDNGDSDSLEELELALDQHFERESQKLLAKGKEEQAAHLEDRVMCIKMFIQRMPENQRTVDHLLVWITRIFADEVGGILVLSTIHKAKGMEWERVFILDPHLMPSRYARQQWQVEAERNIAYVAITRAKAELYYITLAKYVEAS